MRSSWIISTLLVAVAIGAGGYYYVTRVKVTVEAPTDAGAPKSPASRPDTLGKEVQLIFPGQQGPSGNGGAKRPQN